MMIGLTARPVQNQLLRSLTLSAECWGSAAGRKIQQVLTTRIAATPTNSIWRLSLAGVTRIDVSFASEGLVAVVGSFAGTRGICLADVAGEDVAANLAAAAERMSIPVTLWQGSLPQVLGPAPGAANREVLSFALNRKQTLARDLAGAQGLSITNASTRLRQLWERGYLLRHEIGAPSGGTEFVYAPIG